MKVYYYTDNLGRTKGTLNQNKANAMAQGKKVLECDISDFKGYLMGKEWNGSVQSVGSINFGYFYE